MRRIFVISMVAGAVVTSAGARDSYTEDHLRLARQIGAVVGMIKQCEVIPMPSDSVARAIRGAGLRDRDFLDKSTQFHKTVQEQADFVVMMSALQRQQGKTTTEIKASACQLLVENYGPSGTIRAGLVPAR